jgi:uncharacterized protein (UPF0548 family)
MNALSTLRLTRPTPEALAQVRDAHAQVPFSYEDVGATDTEPPAGWPVDRRELVIGAGAAAWHRARAAVATWKMFEQRWLRLVPTAPPTVGQTIAFASHQYGIWVVNTCRVVYVVDREDDAGAAYGFAYGTLATHAVQGEEQFLATWDKATDEVRFSVYKFSRPKHPVIKLLAPLAREVQGRFSDGALQAIRQAVSS